MRHNPNLDGEVLPDDGAGGRHSLISLVDSAAPRWLTNPKADSTSGTIFLLIDLGLPLALLVLLVVIRSVYPWRKPEPEVRKCSIPEVLCPDNVSRCLTWWNRAKVVGFVRPLASPEALELILPPWSMQTLVWLLQAYGTSMDSWSEAAKQFLLEELSTGRSRLCHKMGRPVRVVELVLLVVEYAPGRCLLQEVPGDAGLFDVLPERTPATRRISGERVLKAARRCLAQKVNIPAEALKVHEAPIGITDSTEACSSMPGLESFVRKVLVHVEVLASEDAGALQAIGLPAAAGEVNLGLEGMTYRWTAADSAEALMPHLRGSPRFSEHWGLEPCERESDLQQILLDGSFKALLPWTEHEVEAALQRHGADPKERFGRGLAEMAAQLSAGQCSLGVRSSDGGLVCVQDVVTLLLTATGGQVLVDASPGVAGEDLRNSCLAKLPCAVKLANEDPWTVARRIALSQLGIQAHQLEINDRPVVQQVWPGAYALECEEQHPEGRRPSHWVLREWVVLSHVSTSGKAFQVIPVPATA